MARTKLTAGRIREFTCPTDKGQAFLWDTEASGLALRATPGSEARAFIFQAKLSGKAMRVTIGDVRAWNLDDARAEARRRSAKPVQVPYRPGQREQIRPRSDRARGGRPVAFLDAWPRGNEPRDGKQPRRRSLRRHRW